MVKACKIFSIPIYATTQNAARLGETVSELKNLLPSSTYEFDKTAFSMMIPEVTTALSKQQQQQQNSTSTAKLSIILVGIETHICVTQTTLDLLEQGHRVYILADGVSSCNADERPVALTRLAREGAIITTSESLLFELTGDAASEHFKAVSALVKESKESTKIAVETFCKL